MRVWSFSGFLLVSILQTFRSYFWKNKLECWSTITLYHRSLIRHALSNSSTSFKSYLQILNCNEKPHTLAYLTGALSANIRSGWKSLIRDKRSSLLLLFENTRGEKSFICSTPGCHSPSLPSVHSRKSKPDATTFNIITLNIMALNKDI